MLYEIATEAAKGSMLWRIASVTDVQKTFRVEFELQIDRESCVMVTGKDGLPSPARPFRRRRW